MLKYLKLTGYSIIICFTLILVASCNSGDNEKKEKDGSVVEPKESAKAAFIGGKLDTLWVDSLSFAKLPKTKKVVFSFTFGQLDTLTLHGWSATKNGSGEDYFGNDPDIKLIKGQSSNTLSYGNGTYFGNIILKHKDVEDIKKLLDSKKAQYVLFAPEKIGEHIKYHIYLSKLYPGAFIEAASIIDTFEDANPSPPKTY